MRSATRYTTLVKGSIVDGYNRRQNNKGKVTGPPYCMRRDNRVRDNREENNRRGRQ